MTRHWLAAATALSLMTGVAAAQTQPLNTSRDQPNATAGRANAAMSANTWVKTLQGSLNRNGASLAVDGVIGPKTTAAIKDFQRSQNLQVTGDADWPTRDALNTADARPSGYNSPGAMGGTPPRKGAARGAADRPAAR